MDDTDKALVQFVEGNRMPIAIEEIGIELVKLHKLGLDWPAASAGEWKRRIQGLVSTEKLTLVNGMVWVPIEGAQPKQLQMNFD